MLVHYRDWSCEGSRGEGGGVTFYWHSFVKFVLLFNFLSANFGKFALPNFLSPESCKERPPLELGRR